MIWTRDAEDSLTYVKSNKKVRRIFCELVWCSSVERLDSRSGGLRLSANQGLCVDAEFFMIMIITRR